MNQQLERIAELNRNFNDLGEDLVLDQHTEDICQLARQLANSREQSYCCLTSRPIKA